MTAVKDLVPKDYNDDPNWDYNLTSHLDQEDLKDARELAAANIATPGSSVPQASTMRAGNTTPRETPATELSGNVADDDNVKRVDISPKTATVAVGATTTLTATVTPDWATTKTKSFASSQTSIATVNSSTGVVTGVAAGVKATRTLTSDATNVSDNDTVTLGDVVYRFKNTMAAAYDVKVGASAAASLDNLKAAVNASGTPGTEYFAGTEAHPLVTATTNTDTTQVFEAKSVGVAGNDIAALEGSSHLSFPSTTLTGGLDATATITVTTTDGSKTDTAVVTVTAS